MATDTRYAPCTCVGPKHVHLDDRDDLRRYLDSDDRVEGVELVLECDELPSTFDNALQAERWLWAHDMEDEIERAHEWDLEHFGRRGRI